jgi:hypothetical protein
MGGDFLAVAEAFAKDELLPGSRRHQSMIQ